MAVTMVERSALMKIDERATRRAALMAAQKVAQTVSNWAHLTAAGKDAKSERSLACC